jgi:pyruvyltransferase
MNIYYWKEKKNFGDLLSSLLLKRFSNLNYSTWSPIEHAELVVVGSVLDKIPYYWNGIIAGAGKLHEKTNLIFPLAKILALRGPLTAKGVKGNFALGDPGLLADELVKVGNKEYDLGVIPHWTDTALENHHIYKRMNPRIIRVSDDPLYVISEIGKCKRIVSSSLHGIIIADAFGIPRKIEIAPRMLSHPEQEGGLFKWKDYSASLNMPLTIGLMQQVDRNIIIERQHELFDVFQELAKIFS